VTTAITGGPLRSFEEEDYLEVLGLIVGAHEDSIDEHPEFDGADRVRP
jgi:hypothetical protein